MYKYKRIAAYLIDIAVLLVVVSMVLRLDINQLAMLFVAGVATLRAPSPDTIILTLVIPVLLNGFMTGYFGWTPGKLAMKLRVRGVDGQPVGIGRGFLREGIKCAACTCLIVGFVWAVYGIFTEGRTFYDDWTNSSVDDTGTRCGDQLTDVQRKWRDQHDDDPRRNS